MTISTVLIKSFNVYDIFDETEQRRYIGLVGIEKEKGSYRFFADSFTCSISDKTLIAIAEFIKQLNEYEG